MFRLLTHSSLVPTMAIKPRYLRSITTQRTIRHENQPKEETVNGEKENIDSEFDKFTKEFQSNQIKVSDFQKFLLIAGSSVAALLDPRRQDMIACLGETTGEDSLQKILQVMQTSEEGQAILSEKPRINTRTVNLNDLKNMNVDSFGHHYYKFLEDNVSYF